MEEDDDFVVKAPKKERTPAQRAAVKNALNKLKEKREALKALDEDDIEVKPVKKIVQPSSRPVEVPIVAPKEVLTKVEKNPIDEDMINSIVAKLKGHLVPDKDQEPKLVKKKKKVIVVEESSSDSSSEEEVLVRRKKLPKVKERPTPRAVEAVVTKPEPALPRTTGSRVLDKLFFNK
jgi:hypothetical protein